MVASRVQSRPRLARMCSVIDSLLCKEEIGGSPWSEDDGCCVDPFDSSEEVLRCTYSPLEFVEDDETLAILLAKETSFMPGHEYLRHLLLTDLRLRVARCRAVQWMLKVGLRFNFNPHTISLAANYFDRFVAKSLEKPWKPWMIELLTVGCISIAAKLEEVHVPLLQDLQVEGMDYTFNSTAIRRMELTILSTLEWRMNSVTAFSYSDTMLQYLGLSSSIQAFLHVRVTELLLQSLPVVEFLEYGPSVLATLSLYCALEELIPIQADLHKTKLSKFISVDKQKLQDCYEIMEELVVDPLCPTLSSDSKSPASPVTITEIAADGNAVLHRGTDISKYINNANAVVMYRRRSNSGQPVCNCLSPHRNSRKRIKLTPDSPHGFSS